MKRSFQLIIKSGKKTEQIFAEDFSELIEKVPAKLKKSNVTKTTEKVGE